METLGKNLKKENFSFICHHFKLLPGLNERLTFKHRGQGVLTFTPSKEKKWVLDVYSEHNELPTSRTPSSSSPADPVSQCDWLWVRRRKDTDGVMVQETRLRQLSCRGSTVINQTGATQDTADFPELGQREGILFTCTNGK